MFCLYSLVVYGYYPNQYLDDPKNYPKIDFMVAAVLAMFWLAASAAWANGLTGLKFACNPENWLYRSVWWSDFLSYLNSVISKSWVRGCVCPHL